MCPTDMKRKVDGSYSAEGKNKSKAICTLLIKLSWVSSELEGCQHPQLAMKHYKRVGCECE